MRTLRDLIRFALLLGFWLLLSGHYDPLFLTMGVGSAALVTLASRRLLDTLGPARHAPVVDLLRLAVYAFWLLGRMAASAVQVAWIITHPRQQPRPRVVRFHTQLDSPLARTILANSITLVPGTMTLDVQGGELTVHAFTPRAADDLATAALQNRIAAIFRDGEQAPPEMHWEVPDRGPDHSQEAP